jgi:ABC-type transport system involved in cytochrome bd biosynthesis fused ATPase/permease subunit
LGSQNNEREIDQLKAYSEGCTTLRHYSNASLTLRLASVVQGMAILIAWAVSLTQKVSFLMIALPIAGLFYGLIVSLSPGLLSRHDVFL